MSLRPVGVFDGIGELPYVTVKTTLNPTNRTYTVTTSDLNKPVKISAIGAAGVPPTVAVAGATEVVFGIVRAIDANGDYCSVQTQGYARMVYDKTNSQGAADPTVGTVVRLCGSATSGQVTWLTDAASARSVLIVDVDTATTEMEFLFL